MCRIIRVVARKFNDIEHLESGDNYQLTQMNYTFRIMCISRPPSTRISEFPVNEKELTTLLVVNAHVALVSRHATVFTGTDRFWLSRLA